MNEVKTEMEKRDVLRLSNEESNKLTRECLQMALIYLMSEKPFEKITVTELVKRSGVSRTAFYRNYSSKEDILSEMSNEAVKVIKDTMSDEKYKNNTYGLYCDFFKGIKDRKDTFCLLIEGNMFSRIFREESLLEKIIPAETDERHYYIIAAESAMTAITLKWFKGGMKESVEFMADLSVKIIDNIIGI